MHLNGELCERVAAHCQPPPAAVAHVQLGQHGMRQQALHLLRDLCAGDAVVSSCKADVLSLDLHVSTTCDG